jgi:hypothetical protein
VVLVERAHALELATQLRKWGAREVIHCHPGGDARLIEEHLF